jgi:flagellar biosynthesis protein FlhB
MKENADSGEKAHAASSRKLEQAREQGDVARSADLATAAGYAGFALASAAAGGAALMALGEQAKVLLDQPERLSTLFLAGAQAPTGGLVGGVIWALLPFFLLPGAAALLAILLQSGLVFSPEKIAPQLSRLSPMKAVKQKFGFEGLFEFAKSAAKLVIISVMLALFLRARADDILGTLGLSPAMSAALLVQMIGEFLFIVILIIGSIAGADYLWQLHRHQQRNRMTRQEVIEENRDQEGDPHTKAQRRQRGMDIATNRMLADVPKADVVIVNPTHYAVALKWDRARKGAPVCVAKGMDEVAARIREAAAAAGVPLHSDPPTARALHAAVEIGQEIRPDHYRAVAAAIRFAEAMRRRAVQARGRP